jgi:glycosyltransferase involved in cell wall biosynthesis
MHVLMISLIGDTVHPGQDDACEILDAARSVKRAGLSVTVAAGGCFGEGIPVTFGKDGRLAANLSAAFGKDRPDEAKVPVGSGSERHLSGQVPVRGAALELIPVPRLGIIPVRRAMMMPLAVLLQENLSAVAEVLAREDRGRSYNLIHCFGWQAGLVAGLLARMMDLPLVASVRDGISDRSPWLADPVEAYSRHIRRWLLDRCRAIICPDDGQREKIIELFLVGGRSVEVIPSVTPDEMLDDAGQGLRIGGSGDEARVIYHGSLRLTGGLRGLLNALAGITSRSSPSVRLYVAGPAGRTDRSALSGLIRRLNMADRIVFLEPRKEEGWWDAVLSSMDLMVLTDTALFPGNLLWKALVRGCPLMVSGEGPLASWFQDRGLQDSVCRIGQEQGDRYLERALFDRDLRERISGIGKKLARQMRPLGERLVQIYEQVCRKGGAEVRKGGEHHAVRIAEHGSGGGIR